MLHPGNIGLFATDLLLPSMPHRELSGICSDDSRWQECWKQLASADCSTSALRIHQNSSQQTVATAQALLHNSSVQTLDIGIVEGHDAAQALSDVLKVRQVQQVALCDRMEQ
jgi:hypothetical protein